MNKELCVTSDFFPDMLHRDHVYTREDIRQMMSVAASLGATRFEWILDTVWAIYEDYPGGFDLLQCAADAAHENNMRFDVVFKPFEGALVLDPVALPHTMPQPEGVPFLNELPGIVHAARPFVCEHPEMRLKRKPGVRDLPGPISAIRLVKENEETTDIKAADLSIWTSPINGNYQQYTGPMQIRESVERRPVFPYSDRKCRVLSLENLDIPEDHRYIIIKCVNNKSEGDFTNEIEKLIELVDQQGRTIPSTPALRPADPEKLFERANALARLDLSRYLKQPEVQEILQDKDTFVERAEDMQVFVGRGSAEWPKRTLNGDGIAAVARGEREYMTGALHPIYPEVREHWLDHIRYCIDRDVDGVNIRLANHHRPPDRWEYGFNEPVLEETNGSTNRAEVARVNGNAYTRFLQEARDLLHNADKEIGVHVHGLHFFQDDRGGPGPLQRNFDWQWETWIRDIADYVEFRGATMLRPHNRKEAVDRIGLAAREAGIPFVYQSARSGTHFDGPHYVLEEEMDYVRQHPDVTVYNLYETANFTDFVSGGDKLTCSPGVAEAVKQHWWQS